jgi:hypothetical protein
MAMNSRRDSGIDWVEGFRVLVFITKQPFLTGRSASNSGDCKFNRLAPSYLNSI